MDNTNVNSDSRGGFKRYILYEILMALWVGCGNHKLASCFKNLLKEFSCVAEFVTALLSLWKYFHYRPPAVNFLQESAKSYNENQALPVPQVPQGGPLMGELVNHCMRVTRHRFVHLLCVINKRKEPEALGIFMAIISEIFTASLLILRDVFSFE